MYTVQLGRKYYEAYDDRYHQVHNENLHWFDENPSPIVMETVMKLSVPKDGKILEVGCGEGRDARFLLEQGFDILATDISQAAVDYCKRKYPDFADHFACMDCLNSRLKQRFDFIYAVAVVHMLVQDEDRDGFYRFVRNHLNEDGVALICCQGDGGLEHKSDISKAFDLQERIHEASGRTLHIASTSYRAVSFDTFTAEIRRNGLEILEMGLTDIQPDYFKTMYAVVKKR